jgi:Ca-activated chloride channel family protein
MNSMTRITLSFASLLAYAETASAQGVLIPTDPRHVPFTISFQRITATIHDQAASTRIEQEFRNDTSVALEAHYMFPIPANAAVKDFAMMVDGKRVKGEVVEAPKAKQVYEDIVRRTKDPGLLEHMGKNLWRVRVFPVPARSKQKFELTYTEIVPKDAGVASYTYPLKSAGPTARVDGDFVVHVELRSKSALKSVYSPTHSVGVTREGDHKAVVGLEEKNVLLNRDFQLFWTTDDRDVGLSMLAHRESGGDAGYFMLLVSPKVETGPGEKTPRDVVFVLDTSGSMREDKMSQARGALEWCIKSLDPADRFGVLSFATTVNHYSRDLKKADKQAVESAVEWVRKLEAGGGTAIGDALSDALKMRTSDARNFTVVFLTDGEPTIGETDPQAILRTVSASANEGTRIFTFGVGDDVNARLLDQLAEHSRAVSTYVRPKENLETKVSAFFDKIRRPVLTNLSIDVDGHEKRFSDVYPPKLPDLFHGGQLVVLGRYSGSGEGAIKLKGKIGDKEREFTYKVDFPDQRREADFLPSLWARRKIGYLLDQIRLKGETAELREAVIDLAKKHGIATPYTSYLVVPDGPQPRGPIASRPLGSGAGGDFGANVRLQDLSSLSRPGGAPAAAEPADAARGRGGLAGRMARGDTAGGVEMRQREYKESDSVTPPASKSATGQTAGGEIPSRRAESGYDRGTTFGRQIDGSRTTNSGVPLSQTEFESMDALLEKGAKLEASAGFLGGQSQSNQWLFNSEAGERAVNLAVALNELKAAQNAATIQAVRTKGKSKFLAVGRVWVDMAYGEGLKIVRVKYLSEAYFEVVAKVPGAKEVLSLGPQIIWKTPSGTALVIDDVDGKEKLSDAEWKLLLAPRPAAERKPPETSKKP